MQGNWLTLQNYQHIINTRPVPPIISTILKFFHDEIVWAEQDKILDYIDSTAVK